MIQINGVSFSGSNIQIIGNRILGGEAAGKKQTIDDKREIDSSNVEKMSINSIFADVRIVPSDSNKIEVWCHGEAEISGVINFDVQTVENLLKVILEFNGDFWWYQGTIRLDITVPKKLFKKISFESKSSDLTVENGVLAEVIKADTMSGDVEIAFSSNEIEVSTQSGDVDLEVNATSDVRAKVSTMSGDVTACFNNIGQLNLSTKTMSGDVENHHKARNGYTANVNITTMSGDIDIE